MQTHKRAKSLFILVALCAVMGMPGHSQTCSESSGAGPVALEMRNVMYHFTERIVAHIFHLQGQLIPAKPGSIPVFDDKHSFVIAIASAEISISTDAMANILNERVFADPDAPLKNISLSTDGDALKVKGKLRSKGDIPFETRGTLAVTPEGEIRIHAQKIKAAHIPVKGLMDLLSVDIANLISTKKVQGVRVESDDLVLTPEQILPPPQIRGHVTGIRVRGNEILQIFGNAKTAASAEPRAQNYMAYHGAQLRFGKLTMSDTDMVLIDMDSQDPFDFYLDHYKEQLVAGYTKTTPESVYVCLCATTTNYIVNLQKNQVKDNVDRRHTAAIAGGTPALHYCDVDHCSANR